MSAKLSKRFDAVMTESMTGESGPSLIPISITEADSAKTEGASRLVGARMLPIGKIQPDPTQPRKRICAADLDQLAQSIKEVGLLQPIRVRWDGTRWLIVDGERRYRACLALGLPTIETIEETTTDEQGILIRQLIENVQRVDLDPIEQAEGIKRLIAHTGWTLDKAAEHVGFSKGHVSKLLRILELPPEDRQHVSSGNLGVIEGYERATSAATSPSSTTGKRGRQPTSKATYPVKEARVVITLMMEGATPGDFMMAIQEATAMIQQTT